MDVKEIKENASGYFLQGGDNSLKNYLDDNIVSGKLKEEDADDIYEYYSGKRIYGEKTKKEKTNPSQPLVRYAGEKEVVKNDYSKDKKRIAPKPPENFAARGENEEDIKMRNKASYGKEMPEQSDIKNQAEDIFSHQQSVGVSTFLDKAVSDKVVTPTEASDIFKKVTDSSDDLYSKRNIDYVNNYINPKAEPVSEEAKLKRKYQDYTPEEIKKASEDIYAKWVETRNTDLLPEVEYLSERELEYAPSELPKQKRDATFKDLTVNSFKRGYNNRVYGEESYKDMMGQSNSLAYYDKLLKGDDYNFESDKWYEKMLSNASEFLGGQWHQWADPEAAGAGLGAAGAVILAGQAGPQIAFAEELITAPGAFLTASTAFQAKSAFEVEAGLAYREMVENGISPETARKIALGVGGVNGALEALQISDLVKSFKILDVSDATKPFAKKLYNMIAKRLGNATAETIVEVAQEGVTAGGVNLGGMIDEGEPVYNLKEFYERLKDTATSTFVPYFMFGAVGDGANYIYNRIRNYTSGERAFMRAGAQGLNPAQAGVRAAEFKTDHQKAWDAWEEGNKAYEKGEGDVLVEAIDQADYLDSIGESGIMEGEERQSLKEIPSIEYLEKNAREIAKRSPVEIPENATYDIQEKNGYNQIKYTWERDGYKYTSRWHTRTPGAPKEQGISWVVERRIPGIGYGENHRGAVTEVLVGKNLWIAKSEWRKAINARHNGTATKQQKEWLDYGHWQDK